MKIVFIALASMVLMSCQTTQTPVGSVVCQDVEVTSRNTHNERHVSDLKVTTKQLCWTVSEPTEPVERHNKHSNDNL